MKNYAIVLIDCMDTLGISAKITTFLARYQGNIIDIDQHVESGRFFMRVKWDLNGFLIKTQNIKENLQKEVMDHLEDNAWQLFFTKNSPKLAIFVSKNSHCLYDILSHRENFAMKIELIISNHKILEPIARAFGIEFRYLQITKENKLSVEKEQRKLLKLYNVDFIVLARYMQILSKKMVDDYKNKIINIHHSFLPAFPGAKPYHQAFKRGVKIIGATSHYVTTSLDEGPIIQQDVTTISHSDSVLDLIRKGQDLEKIVLSKAIYNHISRKILTYKNKTIVF